MPFFRSGPEFQPERILKLRIPAQNFASMFSHSHKAYFRDKNNNLIETSQLICRANQLTGFYMMATLAFNELNMCDLLVDTRR